MADELIDIFDEENKFTGVKKMKSEAHKDGSWHRVIRVWIYNSKGEVLIQLRAKDKLLYPNLWDISAAGHIGVGEEPITSCLREIKEEIGLDVKLEDLEFHDIQPARILTSAMVNNELAYAYFLKFDGDIKQLKLQEEEVQEIKFISVDKLEEGLNMTPEIYCPHGDYWFDMLSEVRKKL
ncbi:MAG: NUDIX domain-containing protein [archaeon]